MRAHLHTLLRSHRRDDDVDAKAGSGRDRGVLQRLETLLMS